MKSQSVPGNKTLSEEYPVLKTHKHWDLTVMFVSKGRGVVVWAGTNAGGNALGDISHLDERSFIMSNNKVVLEN